MIKNIDICNIRHIFATSAKTKIDINKTCEASTFHMLNLTQKLENCSLTCLRSHRKFVSTSTVVAV